MPCELLFTEDHSENEYAGHEGGGDLGGSPRQAGPTGCWLPAAAHRRRRTIWAMSSRLHPRARASAV